LGIDPISRGRKVCSFDCIYCQLGKAGIFTDERKLFIPVAKIIEELDALPPLQIDYITVSGTGEPTLAENLGEMIRAIKELRKEKVAVLTNSSFLDKRDVQEDLMPADLVVAKLDASSQTIFELVNRPIDNIKIDAVVRSIKEFKSRYLGKLILQIMFMEQNKIYAGEIARIAKEINPDEVQINTPLRSCGVKPLTESEIAAIEDYFHGLKTISVYKARKKRVISISDEDTLQRRGKI